MSTESTRTESVPGWRSSRLVTGVRRSLAASQLVDRGRDAVERLRATPATVAAWSDEAAVSDGIATLERAAGTSGLARTLHEGTDWVRASLLYRWLTKEPDPEVVVIDLRDTVTVRPVIIALDETIRTLLRGLPTSIVHDAYDDAVVALRDAPIRAVSLVVLVAMLTSTIVTAMGGDRSGAGFVARVVVAALAVLGLRVDASWETVRESRPVELLIAALEPPEPPEEARGQVDSPDFDNRNESDERE